MDLIKFVENKFAVEKKYPVFGAGDTVTVSYLIREEIGRASCRERV